MMTHRSAARVAGILFIIATVAFSLSVALLEPVLETSDYLALVSSSGLRVAIGTLLELTNHIAVVGIAVVLYPVLRRFSERFAVGYVAARSIESVLFAIGTMHLVALASVSHAFVTAGAPPDSYFHTLGDVLLAGHDWDNAALLFTAFSLGALILNYVLFRVRLVPRWLSGWGLVAAFLILAARIMVVLGIQLPSSTVFMMDAPIMLQEMVFAVWLIAKGFNAAVLAEGGEPLV
jgi:hypothetical protein